MRYSLLSRFLGSWLGSTLAEALTTQQHEAEMTKIVEYQLPLWLEPRNTIAINLIESIPLATEGLSELKSMALKGQSDRAALILLPAIIFYADNLGFLKKIVTQSNSYWQGKTEDLEDVLIWGYAISLALREKLALPHLIEQISVGVGVNSTSLIEKLNIITRAWRQNETLNRVVEELCSRENPGQTAIILSLYCFASNPEDFKLSVRRAMSTKYQPETTVALTAALSGAYNSLAGLPVTWRLLGKENTIYQQTIKMTDNLFNTWSGVYRCSNCSSTSNTSAVIASPRIIQPRSALKIISQTEY